MGKLVYSTDRGRLCPDCEQPSERCDCARRRAQSRPAADGPVRIQRQTKGRKGKGVTLVTGLPLSDNELKSLARELKQRCSTGGSVKSGVIEIQGDQREVLQKALRDKGYDARISGG